MIEVYPLMVLSNIDERLSNVDEPKMFTTKNIDNKHHKML